MTRSLRCSVVLAVAVTLLSPVLLFASWSFMSPGNQTYGITHVDLTGMGPEEDSALLSQYREVSGEWVPYGNGWTITTGPGAMPDPFEDVPWAKTVNGPNNETYPVGLYRLTIEDPGVVATQDFFVIQM